MDVLIVICDDIFRESVLTCQGVTCLANRDTVGSGESWNAKIEHRVAIRTKHEHIRVRVVTIVATS